MHTRRWFLGALGAAPLVGAVGDGWGRGGKKKPPTTTTTTTAAPVAVARLTETGATRLTETGSVRTLE